MVAPRQCSIGGALFRRNRRKALIRLDTFSARVVGHSPDPDPSPSLSVALSSPLQARASHPSAPCYRGREPSAARVPSATSRVLSSALRVVRHQKYRGRATRSCFQKIAPLRESDFLDISGTDNARGTGCLKAFPCCQPAGWRVRTCAPTNSSPKGEPYFFLHVPLRRAGVPYDFFCHALGSLQCTDRRKK